MKRKGHSERHFFGVIIATLCSFSLSVSTWAQQTAPKKRLNVLMIVADDMNWDTPGCFGGAAPDITPNLDRLADEGIRFTHAYANISICTPSRSVILTGLYPRNNGAEGFQRIRPGTPNLPALLNAAGYLCGIVGKPLRQQELFRWSTTYRWQGTGDENKWGRDPTVFRTFAKDFFTMSKTSQQPFFLMVNSHDPHRPFGGGKSTRPNEERTESSRIFKSEEVRLPEILPDLPEVRKDFADYCTSVRRLDDMVGAVLDELASAKRVEDTIVIFLADHGMPFPGAKFNCYPDSLRTPLIVRWPGNVEHGTIDQTHMISTLDLQPTILEALRLPPTKVSDGRSFLSILRGEKQVNRDVVFGQFYHIHGGDALPMYSVLTRESAYVFNPWSDGKRRFVRLTSRTFKAMQQEAKKNPTMAARVKHLQLRSVEEFYNLSNDPGCLANLLDNPKSNQKLNNLRGLLREWMVQIKSPALVALDKRESKEVLECFVQSYRERVRKEVEELKPYEQANGYQF